MTTKKGKGRKLPVRRARAELEGDYEGWWFEYRQNPPLGPYSEGLKRTLAFDEDNPASVAESTQGMLMVLNTVLLAWNFLDEAGEDLPLVYESLEKLPLELILEVFTKVNEATQEAPLAGSRQ